MVEGLIQESTYIPVSVNLRESSIVHTPNLEGVNPSFMAVDESRNLNLHEGGLRGRGGTVKRAETKVTVGNKLLGVFQFLQRDGTSFLIRASDTGTVYSGSSTVILTGAGTGSFYSFVSVDDVLYFTDGEKGIYRWSGTGLAVLISTPAVDWVADGLYPQQVLVYGKGFSRRLVTWTTKNKIFFSELINSSNTGSNNGDDFGSVNGQVFVVPTKEGEVFTGLKTFGDSLFIFTDRHTYLFDDRSVDINTWGLIETQFTGGAISWRTVVETPNDLYAMKVNGHVYPVQATFQKGDYKELSVTKPFFLDKWIRDFVDLTKQSEFHLIYDEQLRAIKVFLPRITTTAPEGLKTHRNPLSLNDTALVYFLDLKRWGAFHGNDSYTVTHGAVTGSFVVGETVTGSLGAGITASLVVQAINTTDLFLEGIPNTSDFAIGTVLVGQTSGATATATKISENILPSGYNCSVSTLLRLNGISTVVTGDYRGYLWDLESGKTDDSYFFLKRASFIPNSFGTSANTKFIISLLVVGVALGQDDLVLDYLLDNIPQNSKSLTLQRNVPKFGNILFGVSKFGGTLSKESVATTEVPLGGMCVRIQVSLSDSSADDFFLAELVYLMEDLGVLPL